MAISLNHYQDARRALLGASSGSQWQRNQQCLPRLVLFRSGCFRLGGTPRHQIHLEPSKHVRPLRLRSLFQYLGPLFIFYS